MPSLEKRDCSTEVIVLKMPDSRYSPLKSRMVSFEHMGIPAEKRKDGGGLGTVVKYKSFTQNQHIFLKIV